MLDRAIEIAVDAHAGQTDKAGEPYILHPLRVMLRMGTEDERIVAVLHDVVEDCPRYPIERLKVAGFSPEVIRAIEAVTRAPNESYDEFIQRAAKNPLACAVKRADLIDNLRPDRLERLPQSVGARLVAKYAKALMAL
jgi:(p)ppGpp synthase/HD superfamily hydrolase